MNSRSDAFRRSESRLRKPFAASVSDPVIRCRVVSSWTRSRRCCCMTLGIGRERVELELGGAGVHRDLGDADDEALLEGVDAERLVQEVSGLGLELDRGALEHGGVLTGAQRLQRAAVEEE